MRLINPGLGEVADRLTILALKIAHASEAAIDPAHYVNERNALLVLLRGTSLDTDGVRERLFDLAAVNACLWHAEDDLRALRRDADDYLPGLRDEGRSPAALAAARQSVNDVYLMIGPLAVRIQTLNDQRADLVRALNKLAGTDLGPEKHTQGD